MVRSLITISLLITASIAVNAYKRYDGYKVVRVLPEDDEAVEVLHQLYTHDNTLDFWKPASKPNAFVDIMLHESGLRHLKGMLRDIKATAKIHIENMQDRIDEEQRDLLSQQPFTVSKGRSCSSFAFDQYHQIQEINDWMDCMASQHSSIASTFSIGTSTEGRDLKIIKIGGPQAQKGYWLDAGIHAREWITPATAVYIINQLLTQYNSDASIKSLVDGINFYIIPSLNPDGYAYTFSNDRMWRKTRSGPYTSGSGWWGQQTCYGVDPNRNWDNHWGGEGTSTDPCSEIYDGPKAFSEPETKAAADWMTQNKANLQAYLTLHSYSQDWFYGYGYHAHTYPADVNQLKTVANTAVAALTAVHGTQYTVGSATDILYAAAGASDDWAKENIGIKWTYALELRDTGYYGFQLPANQIIATAEETWAGLKVVAQTVLNDSS